MLSPESEKLAGPQGLHGNIRKQNSLFKTTEMSPLILPLALCHPSSVSHKVLELACPSSAVAFPSEERKDFHLPPPLSSHSTSLQLLAMLINNPSPAPHTHLKYSFFLTGFCNQHNISLFNHFNYSDFFFYNQQAKFPLLWFLTLQHSSFFENILSYHFNCSINKEDSQIYTLALTSLLQLFRLNDISPFFLSTIICCCY